MEVNPKKNNEKRKGKTNAEQAAISAATKCSTAANILNKNEKS